MQKVLSVLCRNFVYGTQQNNTESSTQTTTTNNK